MGVLSEVWVGFPVGEYSGTRAWSEDATARRSRAWSPTGSSRTGRSPRRARPSATPIETATDTAQDDLLAAVGDDLDSVVEQTDAWSQRCVEGDAFPPDIRKRAAG